ncbi:TPA: site-specific integrase, partial [Escherichia coli]
GERYCHVVNKENGEPLYYPNLYITTQVRNRSESISTMKVIAGSISLLYRFFMRKGINIDERIQKRIFLANHEIDDLIEFTSFNFKNGGENDFGVPNVKKPTKYFRITTIANYLEWLCKIHLSHTGQKDTIKEILVFINNIKRKKPRNNDKYIMDIEKSLNKAQLDSLFSILSPGSNLNPFKETVQK